MFCKKCGYKLSEESSICSFCGFKNDGSEDVRKTIQVRQEVKEIKKEESVEINNSSEQSNDYQMKVRKFFNSNGFINIGTSWLKHALIACIGYFVMYIIIFIVGVTSIKVLQDSGVDFTCIMEATDLYSCPVELVNTYLRVNVISQLVGELAVIAIVVIMFRKYIKTAFTHFIENKCYKWYLIGIGILYGGNIVYSIILEMLQLTSTSSNQDSVNELIFSSPLLGFLFVVVAAPLFEEIIFRFGVFRSFTHGNKKKLIIGLVLTTLIFAGVHMISTFEAVWADPAAPDYELLKSDLLSLPVYLIGAFGLTFVYYKSKNIMTSMLVHMTYNGLAFLAILSLQNVEETTQCITNLVRLIFRM